MAWQHFTEWLQPGQMLTKEQHDELIDAYVERALAIGSPVDPVFIATSKQSHYPGRRVQSSYDLARSISEIQGGYSPEENGNPRNEPWSAFIYEIFLRAGADFGLSSSDVNQLFDLGPSRFAKYSNSAHTWNILRRAIQLMIYTQGFAGQFTETSFQKYADAPTWSGARAAFLSAPETNRTPVNGLQLGSSVNDPPYYSINGPLCRYIYETRLSEYLDFINFDLVARATMNAGDTTSATIVMEGDGWEDREKVGPGEHVWLKKEGLTGSNEEYTFRFAATEEAAALDAEFQQSPGGEVKIARAQNIRLWVKPHFTHPYEEIP